MHNNYYVTGKWDELEEAEVRGQGTLARALAKHRSAPMAKRGAAKGLSR